MSISAYAQPATPTVKTEAAGANETALQRCGTGSLTFRVEAPATLVASDQLALFANGTYPPAEPNITGAITAGQGWGYDFNSAGVLSFGMGTTVTGLPAYITGSSSSPTTTAVRSAAAGNVSLNTTPTPIEGTTSLVMNDAGDAANGGGQKFLFDGFTPTTGLFYFRARVQLGSATTLATANAAQFGILLGNNSDPGFSVANTTTPSTGVFAPIYLVSTANTANSFYFSNVATGGTVANASYTSTALTGALNTSYAIEVYGNTNSATRYYYTRNGQVYYVDPFRYDVWIDGTLYAATATRRGDDRTATNNVSVNSILIVNSADANDETLVVDDVRFNASLTNTSHLSVATCTGAGCVQSITTPSIAATTTYHLAAVSPSQGAAATAIGRASTTPVTLTATVNAVPTAPTAISAVDICGPTHATTNQVTFTVSLQADGNAIAFGNVDRLGMDEDTPGGTAGTNGGTDIGNEAGWTGALAGTTVTVTYATTATGTAGLEAGESSTLYAYAVRVNTNLATAANGTPLLNRINTGGGGDNRRLGFVDASTNGVVYPGCASMGTPVVINAKEVPANLTSANYLNTLAPAAPLIKANGATTYENIARCGTGAVTFSVDLNPAVISGTGAQIPGVVELYAAATGGTALATSNPTTDLRNTSGTINIATPSIATHTTYFMGFRRTDLTPVCTSATRQQVVAAVIAVPTAPTVTTSLVATATCFAATQTQTVNLSATQGGTAATHYRFYGLDATAEAGTGSTNALSLGAGQGVAAFTSILGGVLAPTAVTIDANIFSVTNGGAPFTPSQTRTYYVEGLNKITAPFTSDLATGCASTTKNTWTVTASAATPAAPTVAVNNRCGAGVVTITVTGVAANATKVDVYSVAGGATPLGNDATSPYEVSATIAAAGPVNNRTFNANYLIPNPLNTALSCTSATATNVVATANATPAAPTVTIVPNAACATTSLKFTGSVAGTPTPTKIDIYTQATGTTPAAVATGTYTNFNTTATGIDYSLPNGLSSTNLNFWLEAIEGTGACTSATRTLVQAPIFNAPAPTAVVSTPPCGTGVLRISGALSYTTDIDVYLYTVSTGGTPVATVTGTDFTNANVGITINSTATTTTTYYVQSVSRANTSCVSARVAVSVPLTNLTPTAPSVSNLTSCVVNTAFVGNGGNFAFTITPTVSGTVTRLDLLDANSHAGNVLANATTSPYTFSLTTSNTAGNLGFVDGVSKTYYIRAINSGCTLQTLTPVTVTLNRTPDVPTAGVSGAVPGNLLTLCGSGTSTFTFNGTTVVNGNAFRLYTASTGGSAVSSVSITAAPTTTTPTLSTTVSTNTTYYFTQFNPNSTCESARSTGQPILVTNGLAAPTVAAVSFCGDQTVTFTVTGTYAFSGKIELYTASTGGTSVQNVTHNGGTISNTIMTAAALTTTTTYFVEVTTTTPACTSSRTQVIATQQTSPAVPTAANITICQQTTAGSRVTMTVSGAVPNPGGVRLYANNTNNTLATGGPVVLTEDITPTYEFPFDATVTAGTYTYYLGAFSATGSAGSLNDVPGCTTNASLRTKVTVTINSNPVVIGSTPVSNLSCDNSVNTISVPVTGSNIATSNFVRLYNVATGGTAIASSSQRTLIAGTTTEVYLIPVTTPLTAGTSYYVAQVDPTTGCEGPRGTGFTVTLRNAPAAPTANPVSRCGNGHVTFTVTSSTPGSAVVLYTNATTTTGEFSVVDNTFPFELPTANMTAANVASTATGAATALSLTTTYYVAARIGEGANACESARVPVVATVNSLPSAPVLSDSSRRCGSGQATVRVNSNAVAPNSEVRLYTYLSANQGISLSQTTGQLGTALATDNAAPYELQTPGINANTFFHIATFNTVTGCESVRSAFIANVAGVPSLPFANDITRCGVGSPAFTVTRGVVATSTDEIRLYTVATGGTPVTTLAAPSATSSTTYEVVAPTITTTTTYYLSIYNGQNTATAANTCEGPRKMIVATVNPGPSNPTVADVARCSTGTVVLSPFFGAVPGTEIRLWNSATSTATTNLLATVSTVLGPNAMLTITTPSVAATTTFWVEASNRGATTCNSERVAVKVTVNDNPAVPSLSSTSIQSCGPGNVQISSTLTLPVNELRVYTQSIGGDFVANDVRVSGPWVVTVPVTTTSNLFVTARNTSTGCESGTRTQVSVVVNSQTRPSPPVIASTSTTLLCGTGSATIYAAMGTVPGSSIRVYTLPVGGSSVQEISSSPFNFTLSPTQTTTYYLAGYSSSTTCESDRVQYIINVGGSLSSPQVPTTTLSRCGEGSVTFTATFSQINTGDQIRLYTQQTGGDVVSSFSPTRTQSGSQFLVTTPAVQTSTTFYISAYESITGCESSQRSTLALTVNTLPERPTSSNVGRCSLGAVTFTVTMGTPAGTEARLYTVETGGAPIVTDGAAPYELMTPAFTTSGSTNYYVSAISNTTDSQGNRCESPRLMVTAVVTQGVNTPSITANTTVGCGTGSAGMTFALGSPTTNLISGTGVRIYTVATGGTAVLTDDSAPYMVMAPTVNATTTFYAAAYDMISGCESNRIMAVATVVNSSPTTPSASDIITCVAGTGTATFTVMPGNIYGSEARLYTQPTGGSPIQTTSTMPYTFTVNNLNASTTYYVAIGTGTNCESLRRMVTATVNGTPSAPTVSNATRCGAGVVNFSVSQGAVAGSRVVLYDAAMGGNVVSIDTDAPYVLSANINTTTNYWVAVETANCVSARAQVTATLSDQSPIHTFASTNIAVCPNSRGTFIANLNGFGNELRMYNASVNGNLIAVANAIINNTTPFPLRTPVLNGTTQFFVSAYDANSQCETARIPVTATVGNPSAPQVATATVTRCGPGKVSFEAFLTQPTGSELRLYSQAAGGSPVATDDSSPYIVTTPDLTSPRTMFYLSVGAGTCESDRVAVVANVQAGPSLPTSSDVSRCGVGQVTFTVNMGGVPGSYVRLYDAEMGGNIIDQDNSFEYVLTTSFLSTNTDFYVAVGNSSCETSRIRVRALVGNQPGAPVAVASTIGLCGSGSVAFLLNQNAVNPGNAIRLYATPVGGTPVSVATAPQPNTLGYEVRTPVINGTTNFFAAAVSGGCESDRVQLTAIATPAPSQPSANNVTRCGLGPVVFSVGQGSIAGAEIRLYTSAMASVPVAVSTTAPYEVATPTLTTTSTFFLSAATGTCESIRIPVTGIIGSTLAAPSANNVSICGTGSPIFTAISNPGSGIELRLYTVATGGTPVATTDRAPFALAAPAISTNTTYYLASATGNVCESARSMVVATVLLGSTPTAPTASAVTRCGAGSVVITAFMGANPGQSIRVWTAQTGGFLVAEATQGPSYLLNINQVNASATYFISAASGQCESPRIPVQVNIIAQVPTATVSNVALCGAQASNAVFTVTFGTLTGVEARLYTVPFGGAPVAVDPAAPYQLSAPAISFTSTFYVTGVLGSCEGVRVPVTAAIAPAPSNPTAANVAVCGSNTGVISANFGTNPGSEIRLYTQPTGGQAIGVATSFPYNLTVSNVVAQTTYYIASALLGNCESGRTPVVVSLAPNPTITTSVTNESCGALGAINVRVSPTGTYNYLLNGNVQGTPNMNGSVDFTNLTAGTYTVTVTSGGGCRAEATATISLAAAPTTVTVSNINATTATINWSPIQNALSYRLEYRVAGSNANYMGLDLLGTVTSHTLNALQIGTTYEVRVNALCANRRTTAFGGTTFTTLAQSGAGNCSTPTNVTAVPAGPSRATISWTPNLAGAVCYIVSYGPADNPENTWNQFLVQHPTSSITVDVQPGIRYATRVRTNCTTCGLRTGFITPASELANFSVSPKLAESVSNPAMQVVVYPNPSNGTFNIGFNATEEGGVALNVVDLNGRVVYTNTFEAVEGQNEFTIALDNVVSGIYFVNFRQGTNVAKMKIRVN